MEPSYIADKTLDKIDFARGPALARGEYENCRFLNCNFSDADLSESMFVDCQFIGCNLSMVKSIKTVFRDVQFKDCKMLGLHFENCSRFGLAIGFDNCLLTHSSFFQTKIIMTTFKNSQLQEVDFTECDLTGSLLDNCDLSYAKFDHTILEKADLRTSYNYSIDPVINRVKKAKFGLSGLPGLLDKYDIVIDDKM